MSRSPMSRGRIGSITHGLRHLRRGPDLAALRAAPTPAELAALALIPAARNLGLAAGFLAADLRGEATAALLACRVLDAYEDLADRADASSAVLGAVAYLTGASDRMPPPVDAVAARDSEAVDLVLAERVTDVRALLDGLPPAGRDRVNRMLVDIGAVMARNLDAPLSRIAYSEGVLGRVVHYACELVAPDALAGEDLRELTGCVGVTAQLANDLRDGEFALYDAGSRDELVRAIMLRLLAPALGGVALLARLGPNTPSRGARAAMAYMAITTTAFLCTAVGAPAPYPRRLRLGAATLAACAPSRWSAMLERVRRAVDGAINHVLDAAPELSADDDPAGELLRLGDPAELPTAIGPLIVDTTFALVRALPEEPLTGQRPGAEIRLMMVADHLAFGALERVPPRDADAIAALAARFQRTALDPTA